MNSQSDVRATTGITMTWRNRATFAIGSLWAIALAAAAEAYRYDVPRGWTTAQSQGMTALNPSDGTSAGIYLYPPVPAEPDVEKQFARANLSFEQATEVANPIVDIPLKNMTGESGPSLLRSVHYAKGGGSVWVLNAARVERGIFAYAIYVGMDPATFQKHLQEASAMLATFRLGQDGQNAQGAQNAKNVPPPRTPAPVIQETTRTTQEKANASVAKDTGKPSKALSPSRTGAAPSIVDLVGTWVGNGKRQISVPHINFNAQWNYGGFDVMPGLEQSWSVGGGGALLRVQADGSYRWFSVVIDKGCRTVRMHEGILSRASSEKMAPLQFQPTRFAERVEHENDSKDASNCHPHTTVTAPPLVYKSVRDRFSVDGFYLSEMLQLENTQPGQAGYITLYRLERTPLVVAEQPLDGGPGNTFLANGIGPMPEQLQGRYVAEEDLKAGDNTFQRYRAELKLLPGGRYEFAARIGNILRTGMCPKTVTLVESGSVGYGRRAMSGNDPSRAQLTLQPASSRVRESIGGCGEDDGESEFELPTSRRYFKFDPTKGADPLQMVCPDPGYRGPMQAFFCPSAVSQVAPGLLRRR